MTYGLKKVPSAHYSKDYYMQDCDGWREYLKDLDADVHPKFKRAVIHSAPKAGDRVLDIGCGRGEIAYYSAKRGAEVVAIDYSDAAVAIARQTVLRLPKEEQARVTIMKADISDFEPDGLFDKIYMIDVVEHIYDWQLKNMFAKLRTHLSDDGEIFISTPNRNYEKYLFPLKRLANYPYKPIKWIIRILRGKYKPKNLADLSEKLFGVFPEKRDKIDIMHINVMTPKKLKNILAEFDYRVDLHCDDPSYDIFSILLRKWLGRELVAIARNK